MTERENALLAIAHREPEWVPAVFDCTYNCGDVINDRPLFEDGVDCFGVHWRASGPETNHITHVDLSVPPVIDDVTRWRDKLKLPDLDACDSYFFLLEDPAAFQKTYQVLCRLDGSLPEETDQDYETCYLSWEQCPVLADLPVGNYSETVLGQEVSGSSQELLSGLFVARRGFWTERTCDYVQACGVLWETITRGRDQ